MKTLSSTGEPTYLVSEAIVKFIIVS